jgi:hypothetical protein
MPSASVYRLRAVKRELERQLKTVRVCCHRSASSTLPGSAAVTTAQIYMPVFMSSPLNANGFARWRNCPKLVTLLSLFGTVVELGLKRLPDANVCEVWLNCLLLLYPIANNMLQYNLHFVSKRRWL